MSFGSIIPHIFGDYFETTLLFKLTKPAIIIITSFNNLT